MSVIRLIHTSSTGLGACGAPGTRLIDSSMRDNPLSLVESLPPLERAWRAYDDAQLAAIALYRDPRSTSAQRRAATIKALQFLKVFADMMAAEAQQ